MATNTTTINIRIDKATKIKAQAIVEDFGLDISTAIKAFLKKVIQTSSIPFSFEQNGRLNNPKYVARLLKEVEHAEKHGKRFSSSEEMIDDILG
jgi:DNA-damage-inducible protein J